MERPFEWRCGNCGRGYSTFELSSLKKVKMVEEDTDPERQHGFTPVCDCGYVFHKDKWHLISKVELKTQLGPITVRVSTVFLETCHFGYWYETMIFVEDATKDVECDFQKRYKTKEEAKEGHKKVVETLKAGRFWLAPSKYLLEVDI